MAPGSGLGWQEDPRVTAVIDRADLVYLTVRSRRGPHVTPLAFRLEAAKVWAVTARGSVKARVIAEDPAVGGFMRWGDRAVMWAGQARLVDPLTARGLNGPVLDLPLAMAGYFVSNLRRAAQAVRDRPVPTLPIARVVIVVELSSVALLRGFTVEDAWGVWSPRDLITGDGARVGRVPAVPSSLVRLLPGPARPAALGWETLSGPMAFPAVWNPARAEAIASAGALVLAGARRRGRCSLAVDRGGRHSDAGEGLIVRGLGRASVSGTHATVAIEANRITHWAGTRTRVTTVPRDLT